MAVKVAIIYYSATGTPYRLARAVEEGATEAGADVRLRKVRELSPEEAIASNQGWGAHRLELSHNMSSKQALTIWPGLMP
jgi:NAD(P)H dehydrogenase (quinone)